MPTQVTASTRKITCITISNYLQRRTIRRPSRAKKISSSAHRKHDPPPNSNSRSPATVPLHLAFSTTCEQENYLRNLTLLKHKCFSVQTQHGPQHRAFIASRSTTVDVIPSKLPGKVMPVKLESPGASQQFLRCVLRVLPV